MDWRRRINAVINGPGPLIVFQPIYRLDTMERVAFEALARFPEDRLPHGSEDSGLTDEAGLGFSPAVWFAHADLADLGVDLEISAIEAALHHLPQIPQDHYLAVNSGPATIVSGRLATAVAGLDMQRVVVELTEHLAIKDYPAVREAVVALQEHHSAKLCTRVPGVAADDVGAGAASLRHLLELSDLLRFVKLDIALVRGITDDNVRQALVTGMVGMGEAAGFRVVAEGIEDQEQLITLRRLGVHAGQGYHLGRPMPLPLEDE